MLKTGVAASPGIEIGKVYIYRKGPLTFHTKPVAPTEMETELRKFNDALYVSTQQLIHIQEKTERELGKEKADIFDAHLMILEDTLWQNEVREKITAQYTAADYAVFLVVEKYADLFNQMEDEYLRERKADIQDVGGRIIRNILGVKGQTLEELDEEVIVVAKDLNPSDTAQMNKHYVKAFATYMGGRTSHTAIMARSLEIPAVVGLGDLSSDVADGDILIIDGNGGMVCVNPDPETLCKYRSMKQEYHQQILELRSLKDKACETQGGVRRVEISANIGTPKDCSGALNNGAEGIGLYRTEFLYMDRATLPNEDEQFAAYKAAAAAMAPRRVIIRTLDIGGDKKLDCLELPEEMNPFLGWRAIRICLDREDLLKTQLKAILRASHFGKLGIMYPMISGVQEIRRANQVLQQAREELERAGQPYDKKLEVGIMVEIPSAAIAADILIKEADFFSIGTNDLIQYTLAVDRMNEKITHLYNPFHPAILRLIHRVIEVAHQAGKWAGMCGEMAGDVTLAPVLLGMGLDEFSMSAVSIPRVKKMIRSFRYEEAQEMAATVLAMEDSDQIREYVTAIANSKL